MRFLFQAILLSCTFFASAVTLSYKVRPVDSVVPRGGECNWDFSHSEFYGDPVLARISVKKDTFEVSLPMMRYLFTNRGDTLYRHLTETRFWVLHDSLPTPVSTPLRTDSLHSPLIQHGLAFHHDYIVSEGVMELMPDIAGDFISIGGDTISGVILRHGKECQMTAISDGPGRNISDIPDSMRILRTVEWYNWILPGENFPIARTEIRSENSFGKEISRDTETWILDDSEVETVTQNIRKQETPSNKLGGNGFACLDPHAAVRLGYLYSGKVQSITNLVASVAINQTPSGLQIAFPPINHNKSPFYGSLEVLLTDILGRIYYNGQNYNVTSDIQVSNLPPGEYLLQIKSNGASAVRKIILH